MHTPASLQGLISGPRFNTYVTLCNGNQAAAVDLYHWTGDVAGGLMNDFRTLEVLLRNRIDSALANHATQTKTGAGEWFDDRSWINPNGHWWDDPAIRAIDNAKRDL